MAKKPLLTEEDKALFRQHVAKITRHTISKTDLPASAHDTSKAVNNTSQNTLEVNVDRAITAETELFYAKPGLPHKRLKQLKQGKLIIAATLDLHGMTRIEAKNALNHFIATTMLPHPRCALIIHGKSLTAPTGRITLKQVTVSLLKQHPRVMAFASAKPKDGSTGAVYVMIKSK